VEELPEVVISTTSSADDTDAKRVTRFDAARAALLPPDDATTYQIDRQAIDALPAGGDTPFDQLLLQAPGVSRDSAAATYPDFHVRNEYGNVQYRINCVMLPDSIAGLGPFIDTSFIGTLSLLTGTLPAQYGLRTAGVVDLTSRTFDAPGGDIAIHGGGHGTISSSFDYGGRSGNTQYFVALRGFQSELGIENPTTSPTAFHDRTDQGKGFAYLSTILSDSARLSFMAGASVSQFQIPTNPGQAPLGDYPVANANSSLINERQNDRYAFTIAALQTTGDKLDTQIAVFTRFSQVHFVPDIAPDLAFNDVASDVAERSFLSGLQGDAAYRLDPFQTLRFGVGFTAEQTHNDTTFSVLPLDAAGNPAPTPITLYDNAAKLGINAGGYVQDEIRINKSLTLNVGLRFDQLYQYVTANQVSPRLGLAYKPDGATTIHLGYARYFTPPVQSDAAPPNLALAANTTLAPSVPFANPVLPERAHYFDIGADRMLFPGLTAGVDLYYKITTDLIDDGQFGPSLLLSQLNYARGHGEGVEAKLRYQNDGLTAYGNLSVNKTRDTRPISNQYLLDAAEYAYIRQNYIYSDDTQIMTASAGLSYRWDKTMLSADMIYGSGLRAGFANLDHVPAYTQVNLGLDQDVQFQPGAKPLTVRFDVVNLFDTSYALRDGTGIGVFAPQFGPRRGFFLGLSQKL
jgi:hypothetical protein